MFLGPVGGAESHRARAVEQEPGGELAIFHEVPDEELVHSSGDVPVDVTDIVAPLVAAQVEEVGAVPTKQCPVVALQAPVEAADNMPLEPSQDPLRGQERGRVHARSIVLTQAQPRVGH